MFSGHSDASAPSSGDRIFTFTKHKGKTFAQVRAQEGGWVRWARSEQRNGALGEFVEYCNAMDRAAANPSLPHKRAIDSSVAQDPSGSPAAKRRCSSASASTEAPSPTVDAAHNQTAGVAAEGPPVCEKCESPNLPFPGATRCGPCWKQYFRKAEEPFFLRCPMAEKDEAKQRGARWEPKLKKWFVPEGRDISRFERWFVRCDRCGEGLSDHPDKKYDPANMANPPKCQPECKVDREKREDAERQERERQEMAALEKLRKEEAERRRKALKQRVKDDFLDFLWQEAQQIEGMIVAKKEESDAPFSIPAEGLVGYIDRQNTAIARAVQGSEAKAKLLYNPFQEDDHKKDCMPADATHWLRSFGSKKFVEHSDYATYMKRIDYQPITRIFDWALTFHHCFLDQWIEDSSAETGHSDLRFHVRPQQKLLSHLLLQALDPVTPDLKLLIQEQLRSRYGTTCPDVVAIFGSRILPRICATIGDAEFAALGKQQKANWCVLEYMQNRKTYDSRCNETEETTYMRDVLNAMIEELLGNSKGFGENSPNRRTSAGSSTENASEPILACEFNEESTDAIYFANPDAPGAPASAGAYCFMLANPNTKAADLFSLAIIEKAVSNLKAKAGESGAADLEPPSPLVFRQRIFAVFRTLHFRIARKLTTNEEAGAYARYGLDQGLREADSDTRMLKVKCDFRNNHDEMLRHHWAPRDYVGFESKRLHSNTELINVLFTEHLQLDGKRVAKVEKAAKKHMNHMRKQAAATNKVLKKELEKAKVKVKQLVEL